MLSDHLRGITKTVNGKTYTMLPMKGQSGEIVRRIFTPKERLEALRDFYKKYNGGEYYNDFLKEYADTIQRGLFQ